MKPRGLEALGDGGEGRRGDLGSGGGEGRFVSLGLSSPSASSLGLFNGSGPDVSTVSGGP